MASVVAIPSTNRTNRQQPDREQQPGRRHLPEDQEDHGQDAELDHRLHEDGQGGPEDRGEGREVDLLQQRAGGQQGRDRDVDRDQDDLGPARPSTTRRNSRDAVEMGGRARKITEKTMLHDDHVAIGTINDHVHPNAVPLNRDLRSRRAKFQMSDRWDQTVARGRGSRAFTGRPSAGPGRATRHRSRRPPRPSDRFVPSRPSPTSPTTARPGWSSRSPRA